MIKISRNLSLLALVLLVFTACAKTQTQSSEPAKVINNANIPTYVFYYADWCKFCHKMIPGVKKAAQNFENKVFFYYVNIDEAEAKDFIAKYRPNGRGVPYAQLYTAKGDLEKFTLGVKNYEEIESDLKSLLKKKK